jgi:hypothetical protein
MDIFGDMGAETWVIIKSILNTGCENAFLIDPAQNKGIFHDF